MAAVAPKSKGKKIDLTNPVWDALFGAVQLMASPCMVSAHENGTVCVICEGITVSRVSPHQVVGLEVRAGTTLSVVEAAIGMLSSTNRGAQHFFVHGATLKINRAPPSPKSSSSSHSMSSAAGLVPKPAVRSARPSKTKRSKLQASAPSKRAASKPSVADQFSDSSASQDASSSSGGEDNEEEESAEDDDDDDDDELRSASAKRRRAAKRISHAKESNVVKQLALWNAEQVSGSRKRVKTDFYARNLPKIPSPTPKRLAKDAGRKKVASGELSQKASSKALSTKTPSKSKTKTTSASATKARRGRPKGEASVARSRLEQAIAAPTPSPHAQPGSLLGNSLRALHDGRGEEALAELSRLDAVKGDDSLAAAAVSSVASRAVQSSVVVPQTTTAIPSTSPAASGTTPANGASSLTCEADAASTSVTPATASAETVPDTVTVLVAERAMNGPPSGVTKLTMPRGATARSAVDQICRVFQLSIEKATFQLVANAADKAAPKTELNAANLDKSLDQLGACSTVMIVATRHP